MKLNNYSKQLQDFGKQYAKLLTKEEKIQKEMRALQKVFETQALLLRNKIWEFDDTVGCIVRSYGKDLKIHITASLIEREIEEETARDYKRVVTPCKNLSVIYELDIPDDDPQRVEDFINKVNKLIEGVMCE